MRRQDDIDRRLKLMEKAMKEDPGKFVPAYPFPFDPPEQIYTLGKVPVITHDPHFTITAGPSNVWSSAIAIGTNTAGQVTFSQTNQII